MHVLTCLHQDDSRILALLYHPYVIALAPSIRQFKNQTFSITPSSPFHQVGLDGAFNISPIPNEHLFQLYQYLIQAQTPMPQRKGKQIQLLLRRQSHDQQASLWAGQPLMQEDALVLRPLERRNFEFVRLDISLKSDLNGPGEVVLTDLCDSRTHRLTHAQHPQLIHYLPTPVLPQFGLQLATFSLREWWFDFVYRLQHFPPLPPQKLQIFIAPRQFAQDELEEFFTFSQLGAMVAEEQGRVEGLLQGLLDPGLSEETISDDRPTLPTYVGGQFWPIEVLSCVIIVLLRCQLLHQLFFALFRGRLTLSYFDFSVLESDVCCKEDGGLILKPVIGLVEVEPFCMPDPSI